METKGESFKTRKTITGAKYDFRDCRRNFCTCSYFSSSLVEVVPSAYKYILSIIIACIIYSIVAIIFYYSLILRYYIISITTTNTRTKILIIFIPNFNDSLVEEKVCLF